MSLARCMSTWLADPSNRPGHLVARISCVLWIAGSFWTWCAWPQSSDFSSQPLWLWLQIAVVLPLPLTWISLVTPHNACLPARYLWALCTIMCGLSVWATAIYLLGVRPSIGGVDFFFYLVNARDMIEVPQEVPRISYQYFPGVFQFWRFAYRLTNGELSGLQWSYLIVLITNATLIAAIIWSMTKRLELAVLGAIWYVTLLTRFEGLYGITEPIATFPLLAGIFIWQGKPLVTAPDWWRAGLLGVAIGVTVVIKQQAGLLSIATSALLLQQWLPTTARHQWRWLFALPIIAVATAFVCILLEGRGLEPLRVGFEMVSAYEPQG